MGKSTKKRNTVPYDSKRAMAVKKVALEFQCTDVYVRAAIRGDRDCGRTGEMIRRYKQIYAQLNSVLT